MALMHACWFYALAGALAAAVLSAGSGDVRCFCNIPECIATGYMCKSSNTSRGGCFSDFVDYADVQRARHGCLELLESGRHDQCHNQPNPGTGLSQQRSLLLCCYKDMCNHVDSPEIRSKFSDTLLSSTINSSDGARLYVSNGQTSSNSYNSEVWFKAATIAVPICGVVVLFVLIVLAVKMLRKDSIEQGLFHSSKPAGIFPHAGHSVGLCSRKMSHEHLPYHSSTETSSKKVPLLLQQHNEGASSNNGMTTASPISGLQFDKNEANAKLNFTNSNAQRNQPDGYGLLVHPQTHSLQISHFRKPNNTTNNLYRNVNLAVTTPDPTPTANSKLYDKQQLSSVVSWGNASETASHV